MKPRKGKAAPASETVTPEPAIADTPHASPVVRALTFIFVHRGSLWLWLSLGLLVAIYFLARHMIQVALWKLALITIAAYLGFLIANFAEGVLKLGDKAKRPHELQQDADRAAAEGNDTRAFQIEQGRANMLWRRVFLIGMAMIAAALGG